MIGIIGAMEEEVAALKEAMTIEENVTFASMDFCKGTLCGKAVVVVRSGIGKVNAAICTQILVDKFGVDTLINTGIAGSLDANIDIGDMVISTDAVEHDMDASIFGDPIGQVPRMDTFSFPADSELVEKAKAANEEANPDIHTFVGRIVSGDQFVSSAEVKEKLVSNFGAKCTETVSYTHLGLAGIEVYDILRDEYDIQIEFGDIGNILAYLSIGDRKQEVERLVSALAEVKRRYQKDKTGMLTQEYIDPRVVTTPQESFYAEKESLPPVSYTHLDVYKRQGKHCFLLWKMF